MRYKLLGNSGLRVSELCLGTMTFGTDWEWGADKDESKKIFDIFAETGGNFLDTANMYTNGTSEKYVGEFIVSDRDSFVIATKYTLSMKKEDPNASGNHRKNLKRSVEASLKRLNTDYIDLLWVHAWDYTTPLAELMRALDDLVRQGKVLYVGISDTPAWVVARANMLAEERGLTPFSALQVKYSLLERTVERELMPMARELDLAVTPWSVIGGGVLTGKYTKSGSEIQARDSKRVATRDDIPDRDLEIATVVQKIADEKQASPTQVAVNWIRQQPGLIIPLIGARTAEQVKDWLGCLDFTLDYSDLRRLDEASRIDLGFPHEFLKNDHILKLVYGDNYDKIDNHHFKS